MPQAESYWNISGSFPRAMGDVEWEGDTLRYDGGDYRIVTTRERDENGVCLQKTAVTNVSDHPITAGCLLNRFLLPGGEYEVYTQNNVSLNESRGLWQPLHTGVEARSPYLRTTYGAAPMLALWNCQTGRGTVYHLFAQSSWLLRATCVPVGGPRMRVAVEAGFEGSHLNYVLAPGESVSLPDVLFYTFRNKQDLDCHKLHDYMNRHYPRRKRAVIYNTWLYRFHMMKPDGVLAQVEKAKELGADYFVLDASWYGEKAMWTTTRGDWEERKDGTLEGRMAEISQAVRDAGMKFGFWLEAETASPGARSVAEHPDYYLTQNGKIFLDFGNPEARAFLLKITKDLVKQYHASFLKFDFNQDIDYDPSGTAFAAYHAGFREYLSELRRAFPDLYLECCASGGLRMDLSWAREFDSYWLSDNQSPYHGTRIVKETMLRLPPQMIERWVVARSAENFYPNYKGEPDQLFACNDSVWNDVRSVNQSYFEGFLTGGVLGLSCDLTQFAPKDFQFLKDYIVRYREDEAFWSRAVGRILCDTETLLVLQYSDPELTDVRVLVITDRVRQGDALVYPVVDPAASYQVGDEVRTARDLDENGILVEELKTRGMELFRLRKV